MQEAPDNPVQILRNDKLVAALLLGFLAGNLCLAPMMVFLPLFVKVAYHGTIGTLAALETGFGAGMVAGGVFLSTVRLESRTGVKITVGMIVVAVAYLAFILSAQPWFGVLSLVILGFFLTMTNIVTMTLFQTRLKPQNVVTLMSLVNLISVASLPFSMTVVGLTIGTFSIQTIALVCGGSLLVVTLAIVARRELRTL